MSENDATPKMVSAPIRMSPELAEKVAEAKRETGLAQADILRLALAIGLEDLRKVGFDLARLVSDAARPELTAEAGRVVPFEGKVAAGEGKAPHLTDGQKHWLDNYGGIAAGAPITTDSPLAKVAVDKAYPEDHYALLVFGKSMEPKVKDRSYIVVKPFKERGFPKKGTIVVYSDGSGSTLKEFGYRKALPGEEEHANAMGDIPVLRSINKAFPDVQTMDGGRIDAVLVEVL